MRFALIVLLLSAAHSVVRAEAPTRLADRAWYVQPELHGSFFSDVADRSQLQNTFGYGIQAGHRWGEWGLFLRAEHNLWLASEIDRELELGALNIGVGGELLYFGRRMRASLATGPSFLLFDTGLDERGEVGMFFDARPTGLRFPVFGSAVIQWDPLTLTIVAPVLDGIPLIMLEYRTVLAVEFDLTGLVQ